MRRMYRLYTDMSRHSRSRGGLLGTDGVSMRLAAPGSTVKMQAGAYSSSTDPRAQSRIEACLESGISTISMATAASPRSSYAELDGLRIHYLEWGAPDAPTLLLLHALGALVTAHDWNGFAAAMHDTHRVIAPDQRGFGLSDWMPAYSFQLMAQDLAQLVEYLDLRSFSLIGHSMGATVACLYAESGSDRLPRLVLEDTVPPREARL